jgi:hypothetical protein
MQKRIIREMLGLRKRTPCRKKLKITNTNCTKFIYPWNDDFCIKNPDKYQTNDSIHSKDTIHIKPTSLTISKSIFSPKGCLLFLNRIFNKHPPHVVQLRENTIAFKNSLKKVLIKNACYSVSEFMSGNYYEENFKF